MTASVGDVAAQLREVVATTSRLSAAALRARVDATEASASFESAGQGSDHRSLRGAKEHGRQAVDKLGKISRLLAEAAEGLTRYVNAIAPGAIASEDPAIAAPTGERLLEDTDRHAARARLAWQSQLKNAEDIKDSVSGVEDGIRGVIDYHRHAPGAAGTTPSGRAGDGPPGPRLVDGSPHLDHPVTGAILVVASVLVAIRAIAGNVRRRLERKSGHAGQA